MLADATLKSLCKQVELFERAARCEGRPRERVVALGEAEELYFRLYPHHYRALQTIRIASQLGRITAGRGDPLYRCESRLISLLMNIILEAIENGDLQLRDHQGPSELAFTLWSLAFGTRALMDTGVATRQLGIEDGFRVARDASDLLLDALGWKPLSREKSYAAVRERIRESLFAGEYESVQDSPAAKKT
jgi:hypothetical protein